MMDISPPHSMTDGSIERRSGKRQCARDQALGDRSRIKLWFGVCRVLLVSRSIGAQ
jgi:hypothetical protein